MDLYWTGRNIKTMWAMAAIGSACGAMLYGYGTLTGRDEVDGIIAVVLGLYICSHPAALFYSSRSTCWSCGLGGSSSLLERHD